MSQGEGTSVGAARSSKRKFIVRLGPADYDALHARARCGEDPATALLRLLLVALAYNPVEQPEKEPRT